MKVETIETSPEMRRFNSALAETDRLTGYRFDQLEPHELVPWLMAAGRLGLAAELQESAREVGAWHEDPRYS